MIEREEKKITRASMYLLRESRTEAELGRRASWIGAGSLLFPARNHLGSGPGPCQGETGLLGLVLATKGQGTSDASRVNRQPNWICVDADRRRSGAKMVTPGSRCASPSRPPRAPAAQRTCPRARRAPPAARPPRYGRDRARRPGPLPWLSRAGARRSPPPCRGSARWSAARHAALLRRRRPRRTWPHRRAAPRGARPAPA